MVRLDKNIQWQIPLQVSINLYSTLYCTVLVIVLYQEIPTCHMWVQLSHCILSENGEHGLAGYTLSDFIYKQWPYPCTVSLISGKFLMYSTVLYLRYVEASPHPQMLVNTQPYRISSISQFIWTEYCTWMCFYYATWKYCMTFLFTDAAISGGSDGGDSITACKWWVTAVDFN